MTLVKWIELPELAYEKWWYIGLYVDNSLSELARIGPRCMTSHAAMEGATFMWGYDHLPTQARKTIVRKIYKVCLEVLQDYTGICVVKRMPHVKIEAQEEAFRAHLWRAVLAFGIVWDK
jgi:hypothetical protein